MNKVELWTMTNDKYTDFLCYLWERWQDEKEYEDINDYLKAIQIRIPGDFKMTKRPFGFVAKCDDGNIHVSVKSQGRYLKLCAKSV